MDIKKLREERGISQEAFLIRTGLTISRLAELEAGADPEAKERRAIVHALKKKRTKKASKQIHKKYSDDFKQTILHAQAAGMSYRELEGKYGVKQATIMYWLKRPPFVDRVKDNESRRGVTKRVAAVREIADTDTAANSFDDMENIRLTNENLMLKAKCFDLAVQLGKI
jgi:transposase-like protein